VSAVEFRRTPTGATPLVGVGTIAATPDGLRLRGHAVATTMPILVGVAVGILGVIAAASVLVALDVSFNGNRLPLLVGIVCGVTPGALVHDALHKRARGRSIEALVEWPGVRVLARGPDSVTLHLASFELRGEVELRALDPDARALLDATWPA